MIITGNKISMIRGDTESITVSCVDSDNEAVPFVIGDHVYLTLKNSIYDKEFILQKIIDTFTDGKALIPINPADTDTLEFWTYTYDIQIIFADGTVTTIIPPDDFTILSEVTCAAVTP